MGAIDELSAEQIEHPQLRAEEDEKAHDQRPGPQERPELKPELVGGIRRNREIRGHHTGLLHELINDHRREHHSEEGADEEDGPLIDEEVPEPTLPEGDVLRVFRERQAGRQDLLLLAAYQAGDVPDSVAHPVAFVPVVADRHIVQAGRKGREPGQGTQAGRARALRRRGRYHEGGEGTAPDSRGDHDDGDDGDGDEDEYDHDPVRDLQGPGDFLPEERDAEDDEKKGRPQGLDGRQLPRGPRPAEEEREEALSRVCGPASPDEGEVKQADRKRRPKEKPGRHAAERDDGRFAGGDREASELHVVEDLEQSRYEDHPTDPNEAARPTDRPRPDEPFATPDRNPEGDHAWPQDVQDQLLGTDPALDMEDLFRLRQVGNGQRRTTHADLHELAGHNLLLRFSLHHFNHGASSCQP